MIYFPLPSPLQTKERPPDEVIDVHGSLPGFSGRNQNEFLLGDRPDELEGSSVAWSVDPARPDNELLMHSLYAIIINNHDHD
jgi:hypothetical protein